MMFKLVIAAVLVVCALAAPQVHQVPMPDGRIVGGRPAEIEEFPYQVSLLYLGSHTCGGSLIADRWVVTAAHCTDFKSDAFLAVRAGSSLHSSGGQISFVRTTYQHPNYNRPTTDYDIAVLLLETAISFNDAVYTIALPEAGQQIVTGASSTITGWGALNDGSSILSHQLQAVEVPVVSQEDCRAAYGASSITDNMMCAGVPEGGRDACQGDSGGPLVVDGQLIGIVSWGYGCARPSFPGVYASVPALRNFITDISGI